MDLLPKSVLVTGGAGFIGSHLLQLLLHAGANVRAFVKYNALDNRGHISTLSVDEQKNIEIVKGDLRDPFTVRDAMRGVDTVFHLGANISIPYSYLSPVDVYQTNILGTANLAQAALKENVECFIHTSTSEVYGSAQYVPMDERHPLQGQSPYSASKISADKVVESFYCAYNLPVKTIRPFNAYGPRQSMRAVIPTIINQALHCSEIRLGNLSSTRDFTYVEDTAMAFLLAAQTDNHFGEVFNVGSEFEISIADLVKLILSIMNRDIPVNVVPTRQRAKKSEVNRLCSTSQKARLALGWQPTVSLQEGIVRTIDWMQKHREFYKPDEYIL